MPVNPLYANMVALCLYCVIIVMYTAVLLSKAFYRLRIA